MARAGLWDIEIRLKVSCTWTRVLNSLARVEKPSSLVFEGPMSGLRTLGHLCRIKELADADPITNVVESVTNGIEYF